MTAPKPPMHRCWRCHLPYPAADLVEGICENCNDDDLEQAGTYRESRRLV